MTPQDFAAAYLPTAQEVSRGTGIDSYALLAQWGVETAWGSAINNANNLGNIRCSPTTFCEYASLEDFAAAAIATWRNGYYGAVLATAGQPVAAQLHAIGASPWDAGHYNNGGGVGSSLIAAAGEIVLTDQEHQWLNFLYNDLIAGAEDNPNGTAARLDRIEKALAAVAAHLATLPAGSPEPKTLTIPGPITGTLS